MSVAAPAWPPLWKTIKPPGAPATVEAWAVMVALPAVLQESNDTWPPIVPGDIPGLVLPRATIVALPAVGRDSVGIEIAGEDHPTAVAANGDGRVGGSGVFIKMHVVGFVGRPED